MNRDKFINNFLSYYPVDTVTLITPKISIYKKIMDFVYVIILLDGREFYLRFTFDKKGTKCEVVLEEYLGKEALNLLLAHYAVETSINNIKPIDVSTFDNTVLDIIKRVECAYKNS